MAAHPMASPAAVAAAPPVAAPEMAAQLQRLKIWDKLKKGEIHTVTRQNCQELFAVLDQDGRGEIPKDALQYIRAVPNISLTEEDITALANDCDKDGSGKLDADELHKALTQGELAFSMVKDMLGKKIQQVDDTKLALTQVINWVQTEYDTQSALWSLPMTVILFITFMILQTAHMQINNSWEAQEAIRNEIVGEGPPYLTDHEWAIVHDVPTLWEWMRTSFLSAHFKQPVSQTWPYPGRLASYNQIVGGIQFVITENEPAPCEQGSAILKAMYDSRDPIGGCHRNQLGSKTASEYFLYHQRSDLLLEKMLNLTNSDWITQNTTQLDVTMLLYNGHMQMFTDTHLLFDFLPSGRVFIHFQMESFRSEPYQNILFIVPDLIFGCILLRMMYQEMKELIPACMNGLDSLMNYMEFWNIIDWASIGLGLVVMTLWGQICTWTSVELQQMASEYPTAALDDMVFTNTTFLSYEQVEQVASHAVLEDAVARIHEMSLKIATQHTTLRVTTFFYSFVLMMKFFKAFQANPRLEIVTQTLRMAAVDITHFMIIFFVIFFCFSCAGFVVFGRAIRGFSTQIRAMITCWNILMGEFDLNEMMLVQPILAPLWMVSFQFLVLLILLNMLLAIIMDTYVAAKAASLPVGDEVLPTIWAQLKEAARTVKETRGHMNYWKIIVDLTDEDFPAHPQPFVTAKSLRRAFPKMSKHNADYICRRTALHLRKQVTEQQLTMIDAIRLIGLIKTTTLRSADDIESVLEMMRAEQRKPQEARFDAIWNEDQKLPPGASASMMRGNPGMMPHAGSVGGFSPAGPEMHQMMISRAASAGTVMNSTGGSFFGAGDAGAGGFRPGTGMSQNSLMLGNGGANHEVGGLTAETVQATRRDQVRHHEAMDSNIGEIKRLLEEQHGWFGKRVNDLEQRMKKVERGNQSVVSELQGIDFGTLNELPAKLDAWAPRLAHLRDSNTPLVLPAREDGEPRKPPPPGHVQDEDDEDNVPTAAPSGLQSRGGGSSGSNSKGSARGGDSEDEVLPGRPRDDAEGGVRVGSVQKVTKYLEHIMQQLESLNSHAEDSAESRRLLWKIDLGIRQLKERAGAGGNNTSSLTASGGLRGAANARQASGGSGSRPAGFGGIQEEYDHVARTPEGRS